MCVCWNAELIYGDTHKVLLVCRHVCMLGGVSCKIVMFLFSFTPTLFGFDLDFNLKKTVFFFSLSEWNQEQNAVMLLRSSPNLRPCQMSEISSCSVLLIIFCLRVDFCCNPLERDKSDMLKTSTVVRLTAKSGSGEWRLARLKLRMYQIFFFKGDDEVVKCGVRQTYATVQPPCVCL